MKINRQMLATTDFLRRGANKDVDPYRANCDAPQSPTESVRDRFSDDIQGPVDIGVDQPAVSSSEQAAMDAAAKIFGLMAYLLQIKERAFRGMAFVLHDNLNAGQPGLVGNHLNQLAVRNRDKLLVVDPAYLDLLFPTLVVADDQRPNPFIYQPVNYKSTGNERQLF